jgi:hypothetical protein
MQDNTMEEIFILILEIFNQHPAKVVQQLRQLLKHDIVPDSRVERSCEYCTSAKNDDDLLLLEELTLATQLLQDSYDALKHKIRYIGDFLVHKHGQLEVDSGEGFSS